MKILEMKLQGYDRLFLNNINTILYRPEQKIQIILGTNGSGKSSLLRVATVLPADLKNDYNENGYFYIKVEHNNNIYEVSSGYKQKNRHSFMLNGEELNQAGIKKIQLMLVKEHFNLTPQIHEILLESKKFTQMSIAERKFWLSDISNIDYSYPIKVFNNLKKRHRDIVGGIKIINNRYVQDNLKLMDKDLRNKLKKDLEHINQLISLLLASKDNKSYIEDNNIDDEIDRLGKELKTLLRALTTKYNLKELENAIYNLKDRINYINNDINKIRKDIDNIDVNETSYDSNYKDTLVKEKELLEDTLKRMESNNNLNIDLDNIETIIETFNYIITDLTSLLDELYKYNDYEYTQEILNNELNKLDKLTNDKNKLDSIIENLSIEKKIKDDKLKEHKIKCVNCGHEWHLDFDEQEYEALKRRLVNYIEKANDLNKKLKEQEELVSKLNSKKAVIDNILQLIKHNLVLKDIFKYIIKNNLYSNNSEIQERINEVNTKLHNLKEYKSLKDRLQDVKNRLTTIKMTDTLEHKHKVETKNKLNNQLSDLINTKSKLTKELDNLLHNKKILNVMEIKHKKITQLFKDRKKYLDYKISKIKNDTIAEAINYLKYEALKIENEIKESDVITKSIENTKKELEDLKIREKVLNLAIKDLSPTEGLIAKSINSFLNLFIDDINHIINSIWSYEMVLLPCEVNEENDLDYQFPVLVNNTKHIKDISKTSSSMQDIINLAFRIVFMRYKGLQKFPLILDEFGSSMDPKHRISAYNVIDRLAQSDFEQIFIVSHFESMYGRFTNADISILSTDNLIIDNKLEYNKVMKIN